MSYSVYKHTFPNGKVYIGITRNNPVTRWANGAGYPESTQKLMFRAINKYGWENIKHEILCTGLNEHQAKSLERYYITEVYKSNNRDYGYNRTNGGDGVFGYCHSNETLEKISQRSIAMWSDSEFRKIMSEKHSGVNNSNYGKSLSEYHKNILSDFAKSRTGEKNPFYGKHHSEESKEKNRVAHIGKNCGSKNINSKPVKCIETGEIFESAGMAAKKYGVTSGNITSACRGNSHTACGYHWEYIV